MKTKLSINALLSFTVGLAFLTPAVTMAASTVTFGNQSGKSALVKLVGPTTSSVTVADGKKESVSAAPGHYFIKVRYGTTGAYSYSKGDEFDVAETATSVADITITLHKVVAGNYGSKSISEAEFGPDEGTGKQVAASNDGPIVLRGSRVIFDWRNDGADVSNHPDSNWPDEALENAVSTLQSQGFTVLLTSDAVRSGLQTLKQYTTGRFGGDTFAEALSQHLAAYKPGTPYQANTVRDLFKGNRHCLDKLEYYRPWGSSFMAGNVVIGITDPTNAPRVSVHATWESRKYTATGGPFPAARTPIIGATVSIAVSDASGTQITKKNLAPKWPEKMNYRDGAIRPTLDELRTFMGRIQRAEGK